MKKKLFITDLDGTLLDHNKNIPENAIAAIEAFQAAGGLFTIATGRTEVCCHLVTDHVTLSAPAVIYNGACVMDLATGHVLWDCPLTAADFRPLALEIMEQFPDICIEIFAYGPQILVNPRAVMDPYIIRENQAYQTMELEKTPEKWLKLAFSAPHERLQELESYLDSHAADFPACTRFYSADYYYEILAEGCTKAGGAQFLADWLQIPPAEIAVMGDHLNDEAMLRWGGIPYCPANAHEAVRAIAAVTPLTNDQGAVAQALEDFRAR